MKKILSLLLVFALLFGVGGVSATAVNDSENTITIGNTFTDEAGIEWRVLHITETGQALVITVHAYGNEVPGEPFAGIRYHNINLFVPLREAEINERLVRFWDEMGENMRNVALVVDLGIDFRVVGDPFPEENEPEAFPRHTSNIATAGPGNIGYSSSANGTADSNNALFLLTMAEARYYFHYTSGQWNERNPAAVAYCREGRTRSWWLRSPGSSAGFTAVVGREGTRSAVNAAGVSNNLGLRPALWIDDLTQFTSNQPLPPPPPTLWQQLWPMLLGFAAAALLFAALFIPLWWLGTTL